jgi:glycosyltransferase involved in cell wall biosynthesis
LSGRDAQADAPLVSVVMPAYNAERFLRQAIESVLAQTYTNFELVVIDDGSSDGSWAIMQELAARDTRVRAFRNERNLGIVRTRNRLFAESSPASEYFAVLDGDDVCLPERLALQVAFLQAHADHALVGGNLRVIDEYGVEVGVRRYPSSHEAIMRVITRYNPIAQPASMFRRSAVQAVGEYDERYARCQDYELWLRMAERFKLANLDAFVIEYRVSATQGKSVQLRESLAYTIDIQRRWLFRRQFFRPFNVLYWGAEHALMLLPDALVLGAFKHIAYKR